MGFRSLRLPAAVLVCLLGIALVACGGGKDNKATPTSSSETPGASGTSTGGGGGSGGATVTLSVTDGAATVGETATVELKALDVGTPGLGAWTVDVAYDKDIVSATCEANPEEGMQFCNPTYDNPDDDSDDLAARLASANPTGTDSGDVSLMTITFTCKAAGSSDLSISVSTLADATIGNPTDINHHEENGTITCS